MPGRPASPCKLCDSHAALLNSHSLPAWAFGRLKGEDPQFCKIGRSGRTKSNDELREYLLCSDCERRCGLWDQVAAEFSGNLRTKLRGRARLSSPIELPPGTELVALDEAQLSDALLRFGLSVLWRASVSSRFEDFALSPRLAESVRTFLLCDTAPVPDGMNVVLTLVSPSGESPSGSPNEMDRTIVIPQVFRLDAHRRGYRVSICELDYRLLEGPEELPFFSELDLGRRKRALVSTADDEWAAFVGLMAQSPRRGALAQRSAR